MKALFDTNVLIDYLVGVEAAREEIQRFDVALISPISWIEVMVGATEETTSGTRAFLSGFNLVPIDQSVSNLAVQIRQRTGIKLPDAIIWASARAGDALLITRNEKDFPDSEPDIRIPYQISPASG